MNNSQKLVDNEKKQKKTFKEYRKRILKALFGFVAFGASLFILPEFVFAPLYNFMKGFISENAASSITFFTQMFVTILSGVSGIVNSISANRAKHRLNNYQNEAEEIVNSINLENEELLSKVKELEKQKLNVNTNSKTNSRSSNYRRNNNTYTNENVKVKKYTR